MSGEGESALPPDLDLRSRYPISSWIDVNNVAINDDDDSFALAAMDERERKAVHVLATAVKGCTGYDPRRHNASMLLRFARSEAPLEAAVKLLVDSIAWKQRVGVDRQWLGPLSNGERVFAALHSHSFHGVDVEHSPVFYDRIGETDCRRLSRHVTSHDVALRYARVMEQGNDLCRRVTRHVGRHVDSIVFVFDLNNIGYSRAISHVGMFSSVVGVVQKVYSGSLKKLLIINSSFLFLRVWPLLLKFIDTGARAKIEVLGHDFHKRLYELVPRKNVPRYLGGHCSVCTSAECIDKPNTATVADKK